MLRQVIGLALIVLAWFNPLGLDVTLQAVLFILGFDMTSLWVKIGVFLLDFFLDFSTLGIPLVLLVVAEVVSRFILVGYLVDYILKPVAVFAIIYLNGFGIEIAIIVAGIDLLLNMGKKWL